MSIATSITLVEELKKTDNDTAWNRFYELYAPLILGFARQRGFGEASAKDILQETMCQLFQYLEGFNYNPQRGQFRSYLLRIVMSRMSKYVSNSVRARPLTTSENGTEIDVPDPNSSAPWDDFEMLWKKNLLKQALARVKAKVKPLTWRSFECYALQGYKKSGDDVAEELGINKNRVYQHKNRVIDLLRQEVKDLESEIGDDTDYGDLVVENYTTPEAVKTLLVEDPLRRGDWDHFNFLRQLFVKSKPSEAYTQFILVDSAKNKRHIKLTDNFSIGTDACNQLCLESCYVSRKHCLVTKDDQRWVLEDLKSTNGVLVNNRKMKKRVLVDGDIVQIGDQILVFFGGKTQAN